MPPEEQEQWPEHVLCARCGEPLDKDYRENPVGLRFCVECFETAIKEKLQRREAEIYLKGRCTGCGCSLINGYRLSKFGVIYCLSCHRSLPKDQQKPESA